MSGRQEREQQLEITIRNILDESPEYFEKYYYSLVDKTYTTRLNYLRKTLAFLKHLKDTRNIIIDNMDCFDVIKPSDITIYFGKYLNGSGANKACCYYAIKSFFSFLLNDGCIDSNPLDSVKPPKDNKHHEITYLTSEEIIKIQDNIKNGVGDKKTRNRQKKWRVRDYTLIMFAISTGQRISSILEINISDINFDDNTILIVEKGNKERLLHFSDSISKLLTKWISDRKRLMRGYEGKTDALFISRRRSRLDTSSADDIIKKYTYNIDKKISMHKLRSTYATHAIKKTHDIYLVANQLGHSNIKNTARYAAIDDEMAEKAASVMDDVLF